MPCTFSNLKVEVVKTLAYSAVFGLGLKIDEIHKYISIRTDVEKIREVLEILKNKGIILEENGVYALDERFIKCIFIREGEFRSILEKNKYKLAILFNLPFVRGIFITGSVAAGYPNLSDDLDVLIICKAKRLYTCRLFVMLLVKIFKDICPNYFLSEEALTFNLRDYYVAREISQMIPVGENSMRIYEDILRKNPWVKEYLPNYDFKNVRRIHVPNLKILKTLTEFISSLLPERSLYTLQKIIFLRKYGKYINDEVVIDENVFKAHISSNRKRIMENYQRILKEVLSLL